MSQSRFSIVLVGVSALLRRPLVSRLRPADGERSPWVVFAARGGRFDSGFRSASWPSGSLLPLFGMRRFGLPSAGWPSGSLLPLFGMHRFGVATGRVRSSAFRFGDCPRRVGLRAHCFRFSARAVSELPFGELAFGLTASAFRHAPLRSSCWASSFFRLPLRSCGSAGWPSDSLLPLFGTHRFGVAAGRVRSSAFRFGDCRWVGWPSGSLLPLFGMHRFGVAVRRAGSSAFRFGDCRSASWPSGSLLPLFGTHRFGDCLRRVRSSAFRFGDCPRRVGLRVHRFRFSACADPHRRAAETRTDGAQRHDTCFTSKHLSQHVNLPHRTP